MSWIPSVMTLTWGPADNRELILHFFYRTSSIIDQKKAGSEDIDGMMRRIDDLFAREKRKAATGKTDADYAKLPLLMKFEDRARYVQDTYRTSSVVANTLGCMSSAPGTKA